MAALAAPFLVGAEAVDLISLVADGVSLIPMVSNFISPKSETPQETKIRITVGQSADNGGSFDGDTPGVALWDMFGQAIGHAPGNSENIPAGAFIDVAITANKDVGNVQAHYLSLTAGGIDAICITGFSVTFPDGATAGYNGGTAFACGVPWGNSIVPLAGNSQDPSLGPSRCVWLDQNDTNGLKFQGLGVHLPSFCTKNKNLATTYNENPDLFCKSGPRFRMYEKLRGAEPVLVFNPPPKFWDVQTTSNESLVGTDFDPNFIIGNPGVLADPQRKRLKRQSSQVSSDGKLASVRHHSRRFVLPLQNSSAIASSSPSLPFVNSTSSSTGIKPEKFAHDRVIVSPHTYNTARDLCMSESSWGPSFVSLPEALFCDMSDKTLYHLCSSSEAPSSDACCYDTNTNSLLGCQQPLSADDGADLSLNTSSPVFTFSQVGNTTGGAVGNQRDGKTFADVEHW